MRFISYLNRIIEYSFYALFLLVPLVFSGATSELFEFPKMWLTFGLTIVIGTAWIAKMILQKRIQIQRTPLDIPLLLFLTSQIVSSIFSLDPHVSLWGYYSRFNGGLFSIIAYIFLYYALVSNFLTEQARGDARRGTPIERPQRSEDVGWERSAAGPRFIKRLITVGLFSGIIVALWGFPSHFGIDPTCFVFRGSFDTSCWTDAFKPTIRIFSTLGQPAWLAAFMALLIPLAIAFGLNLTGEKKQDMNKKLIAYCLLLIVLLFYADLLFTNTRAGFIAFWTANALFWAILFFKKFLPRRNFIKYFLIFNLAFLLCNFFIGSPIESINKFTLPSLTKHSAIQTTPQPGGLEGTNITDSGNIRLLVWQGAIDAWKDKPLFGTGVETFAFAYYQHKPIQHNLTSEWDFLYNKAHNEYLNYLATSGIFGLGSYLLIIGFSIFYTAKWLLAKGESSSLLITALLAGYISILISNFFGFSVVIINLYFFLIPAFVFILTDMLNQNKNLSKSFGSSSKTSGPNFYQWALFTCLLIGSGFILFALISYWNADIAYATGSNLNKAGSYQEAYPELVKAVNMESSEPVYKDELAINMGTLAEALYLQKDSAEGAKLSKQAIALDDEVVSNHPNDIVFWKNRVRLFYTLSQGDPAHEKSYLAEALKAISKAKELAPTDAKISYNLGVLVGQRGEPQNAIKILTDTIKLKPDYRDAYFALGLFYHEVGENQKAIYTYQFILKNLDPNDKQVKETLKSWGK